MTTVALTVLDDVRAREVVRDVLAVPSTGGADAGLSASRAIFQVSISRMAEPPIHTTQRTALNCSSAAMPASASAA